MAEVGTAAGSPGQGGGTAGAPTRQKKKVYTQLWFWVIIGIVGGALLGWLFPEIGLQVKWLADAFIQMIKVIVGPVIFCTVVVGIASIGNLARAGGLAARALIYFMIATAVALTIGLLAANIFAPGTGFTGSPSAADLAKATGQIESGSESGQGGLVGFLLDDVLPTSFLAPFVDNEVLRVLVLAILTACAVSALAPAMRERVVGSIDAIAKVIFGIIKLIMWAAPVAAFGGMAYTVAAFGAGSLGNLLQLMAVFWGTCLFFVVVILGAVSAVAGFNIFKVIRLIKDELLIIVGTSSSESVLPRLLTKLQAAGASKQTVGMVIPTGYSFNLDGTCIYLTLGALFIAQAGGVTLPVGLQIGLALLMVLTSKGAAGVTGAGLITLSASLQAFGGDFFTPEAIAIGIAVIIGIDRVMSEGRALTNCIGNVVATLVIARWNGELDRERLAAVLDDPSLVEEAMAAEHGGRADAELAEKAEEAGDDPARKANVGAPA
ncbi:MULTISPECIES: cation:dicarboxylate symporter family transporter [Pseudonocardia]|uniref:Aerobic C4-dicarboxylate transport protein n=2 Tax=Pseudonocardia TaxID=1847 RepID=A0A1Y2N1F9_PSEAH|nr:MULTISPECIES: cation:dicarboxylase symporter family transporter [Pseudonocardia]OSY41293.1 Aerobic C4-dicarboxylate transport protein [Pseudonocardia autotrophica]TDN76749.1 Na+/H+-dicarboxylate symporter [Pseudonocardia autotrophica]BBG00750.1 C4-dicarboxylate transport protein [Pseudonocardia autotrophica]GEC24284.1 C4-dicarboxylate transport protein [Pseudonocardia saturnea]